MRRLVLAVGCLLVVAAAAGCVAPDPGDGGDGVDTGSGADGTDSDDAGDTRGDDAGTDDTVEDGGTDPSANDGASPNGTLEVHAINVGQADATLVIGPTGETMLIDSGDWRDDGETVLEYLRAHDVDRIDHLVTTHPHADHIGGHAAVIEYYETEADGIGAVYDPGVAHTSATYDRYLDAVEEHDVALLEAAAGDEIPFEGVGATVYNPPPASDSTELHEASLTLRLEYGETAFLFTGDAEAGTEDRMAEAYGDDLSADVFHAGHHGSRTSSSDALLEVVDPAATVVSSDYDSQYGHPHEEALDRFAERGIEAYWTATHGTIVFTSDGETIAVATQTDAPTAPGQLRDAPETTADPTAPATDRTTLSATLRPPAGPLGARAAERGVVG